jgi:aspartate ammonia-lyase
MIESLNLLIACDRTLGVNLFEGLQINNMTSEEKLYRSPAITTALIPYTGYNKASELAKIMKEKGIDIFAANKKLKLISEEQLRNILKPENLLKLGYTVEELINNE